MTQLLLSGCTGIVLPPDEGPDRDTWCTPKWLADAVGEFDLDPCSNERSHIKAVRSYRLEDGQNGLALAPLVSSEAHVWCNPPYSSGQVIRWVRAYGHTRFCFLVRFDPSTEWFGELAARTELVLLPMGRRINFEPPPGVKASSATFPHALFYARASDATPAIRALCFQWRVR